MTDRPVTLIRLQDSAKMVADPDNDIRGRTVRDRAGDDIGKVEDLLIDTEQEKIRFLRVEHGGILGFGTTPSFIPVEAIKDVTDDEVHIDQAGARVAEAPLYDPDLLDESEYYKNVYTHYGYPPYWTAGYTYPARPYLF